ncbi:gamma carbonic anhydrase family protein [Chloroflexota bacterium]
MLCGFRNRSPQIGKETYVSEQALLIGDVRIGNNCYIGHGAILRGDYGSIEIGWGTAVEEGVVMHAPPGEVCRIGDRVTIGHGAIVHSAFIGDYALIGMGAVLSVYSEIEGRDVVAEGAVVTKGQKIPSGVVVGGNPASILREVTDVDMELWDWGKQLYINLAREYLRDGMQRLYSMP